jgi:type II secretory pathway pseudopilin PulG
MSRQGELAFTMVEIAIAIGVIGFALVAIIGILPGGHERAEGQPRRHLISQDAPYFLDAIRNGAARLQRPGTRPYAAQGLDFLTNYVQSIQFVYVVNGVNTATNTYPNRNFTRLAAARKSSVCCPRLKPITTRPTFRPTTSTSRPRAGLERAGHGAATGAKQRDEQRHGVHLPDGGHDYAL